MGIYEDVAALQEDMLAAQSNISILQTDVSDLQIKTLAENTDLNDLTPGNYLVPNATVCATLLNKPIDSTATTFIRVTEGGNSGQLIMQYLPCTKETPSYYQRAYYYGSWGDWNVVNVYDSDWQTLPLSNGATAFDSAQVPQYRRIGNVVYLRGVYKNVISTDTVVATLPINFRPSQRLILACVRTSTSLDRIEIETDGTINYMSTTGTTPVANTWHSLANISFVI